MSEELRLLDPAHERGCNLAAAVAQRQLEYALSIIGKAFPDKEGDPVLVGAVLQAIASNYAASN